MPPKRRSERDVIPLTLDRGSHVGKAHPFRQHSRVVLHERLAPLVANWTKSEYPVEKFPAIGEILEWARGDQETGNVRFLREPQLRALETDLEGVDALIEAVRRDSPGWTRGAGRSITFLK